MIVISSQRRWCESCHFFLLDLRGVLMPGFFNRLPGFSRGDPGCERDVLRLLPRAFWLGSLLLGLPSLLVRLWFWWWLGVDSEVDVMTADIYVLGLLVLHWTVLLTGGLAAFIVMVMKGPAYVADPYPLTEVDEVLEVRPGRDGF